MDKLCVSSKCFPEDGLMAVEALIGILRRPNVLPSENVDTELHTLRLACEEIRKGYRENEIARTVLGEEEAVPVRATVFPSSWSVQAVDGKISMTLPVSPLTPVGAMCFAARIVSTAEKLDPGVDFEDLLDQSRRLG